MQTVCTSFFHHPHETASIPGDVHRHGNGFASNHRDRDAAKLMQRYAQSRYGKFHTGKLAADVPLLRKAPALNA